MDVVRSQQHNFRNEASEVQVSKHIYEKLCVGSGSGPEWSKCLEQVEHAHERFPQGQNRPLVFKNILKTPKNLNQHQILHVAVGIFNF